MMSMMMYTSFPLEDMLEVKVWKDEMPHLGNALFIGNLDILRQDSRDVCRILEESSKIDSLLGTDVHGWHGYEVVPHLEGKLCVLFLLIYRFLRKDMHMVMYKPEFMKYLDPESRVSCIDISTKKSGETAMHIHHRFVTDTLYHFIKTAEYSDPHDTGLLDRMGQDGGSKSYPFIGYRPNGRLTVGELMEIAGNCPAIVTVHDQDKCASAALQVPFDENNSSWNWRKTFPDTLEFIEYPGNHEPSLDYPFEDVHTQVLGSKYSDMEVSL